MEKLLLKRKRKRKSKGATCCDAGDETAMEDEAIVNNNKSVAKNVVGDNEWEKGVDLLVEVLRESEKVVAARGVKWAG